MNPAKNRTLGNSERSIWLTQLCYLASRPVHELNGDASNQKRVMLLIESQGAVTVSMVMKLIGVADITARRILDDLTPGFAREIPGRPKKWRKA